MFKGYAQAKGLNRNRLYRLGRITATDLKFASPRHRSDSPGRPVRGVGQLHGLHSSVGNHAQNSTVNSGSRVYRVPFPDQDSVLRARSGHGESVVALRYRRVDEPAGNISARRQAACSGSGRPWPSNVCSELNMGKTMAGYLGSGEGATAVPSRSKETSISTYRCPSVRPRSGHRERTELRSWPRIDDAEADGS